MYEIFRHLGRLAHLHTLLAVPQVEDQHTGGRQGGQLNHKEEAYLAVQHKEIQEIHAGIAAQQDGGGIPHQGGHPLQVGEYRNGDDNGHRRGLELAGDLQGHRGHNEHGGHIVHEGRDQAGEKGQGDGGPLHRADPSKDPVGQKCRHAGQDKEPDRAHCARDHHDHVPVNGLGQAGKGHDAQSHKEGRRGHRHMGAPFGQGQQQGIGTDEKEQRDSFHFFHPFTQ